MNNCKFVIWFFYRELFWNRISRKVSNYEFLKLLYCSHTTTIPITLHWSHIIVLFADSLCSEILPSWPQFQFLRSSYSDDFRLNSATAMTKDDDDQRRDVSRLAAFYCYIYNVVTHIHRCVRWFFLVRQRPSRAPRRYWSGHRRRRRLRGGITSKLRPPDNTRPARIRNTP